MEKGYKIEYASNDLTSFLVVSNYDATNEIWFYRFKTKTEVNKNKDQHDLGVWQPKGTKKATT